MRDGKSLHISILVGRSAHPQAVIDDLWNRAAAAVGDAGGHISGTAVYTHDGETTVTPADDRVSVVALPKPRAGRLTSLVSALASKAGPVGVVARLVRDNLESRRLARTMAGRADLVETFSASDVVVAADITADRSVWQLRNRTAAGLVHGPVAMLHALRNAAGS
ncbi:hypothetical protein [Arthrobacter sp. ZGTC131]|uniref:hypothetical protein n=1 Tax=Arthrobacter sp. ZGTC131 TaxID=2058898 RepID=UPI000CE361C1|nr:hypothetical protein [Arthrobacter sp. ZGTC131]